MVREYQGNMPPEQVVNEILETAVLVSAIGADKVSKASRRIVRFKPEGSLEEGDLKLSYTFPDGSEAKYELIHGVNNAKTGFQAAAFQRTLTSAQGEVTKNVKIIFPGTAMRIQFHDPNVTDTFFFKRIGDQIHKTQEWLDEHVIPALRDGAHVELCSHCLGTQAAIWAKPYLERMHDKKLHVDNTFLLEPTSPGLVFREVARELSYNDRSSMEEAGVELAKNMQSVVVLPTSIIMPLGYGVMWDVSPVGQQAFSVSLPDIDIKEEMHKVLADKKAFNDQLNQEREKVTKKLQRREGGQETEKGEGADKEKEGTESLPTISMWHNVKDLARFDKVALGALAETELGSALTTRYFRNHYAVRLAAEVLENGLENLKEMPAPDTKATVNMHQPDLLGKMDNSLEIYQAQGDIGRIVSLGRTLGRFITNLLPGKAKNSHQSGVPFADPDAWQRAIWNTNQIHTMDDTLRTPEDAQARLLAWKTEREVVGAFDAFWYPLVRYLERNGEENLESYRLISRMQPILNEFKGENLLDSAREIMLESSSVKQQLHQYETRWGFVSVYMYPLREMARDLVGESANALKAEVLDAMDAFETKIKQEYSVSREEGLLYFIAQNYEETIAEKDLQSSFELFWDKVLEVRDAIPDSPQAEAYKERLLKPVSAIEELLWEEDVEGIATSFHRLVKLPSDWMQESAKKWEQIIDEMQQIKEVLKTPVPENPTAAILLTKELERMEKEISSTYALDLPEQGRQVS